MTSEKIKGHLAAITLNVIFGLNISVIKALFSSSWMTPAGLTITRMGFGCVMFWLISSFKREKVRKRDLFIIGAGSFLGLALAQFTFSAALPYTSPVTSSLIIALTPMVVLLLSALFLKDPVSLRKAAGVLMGISGAILIVTQNKTAGGQASGALGIILVLVSITGNAGYIIIIRKTAAKYAPITIMKWLYLFSFFFLLPVGFPELPGQRLFTEKPALVPILELGFVLFFSTLLAFFLMPVALRRIKATTVSMYSNLQPLAASTAAIIAGQDVFTWDKPLSLFLIVCGIFIVTYSKSEKEPRPPKAPVPAETRETVP